MKGNRNVYLDALPHRAIAVYMYLNDRANREGICFPGMKKDCTGFEAVRQYG